MSRIELRDTIGVDITISIASGSSPQIATQDDHVFQLFVIREKLRGETRVRLA
jgi:hypothetical protein